MRRSEFEDLIAEALDQLPDQFQKALHNIEIRVRWRPSPEELAEAGVHPGGDLFGLYVGVPLTQRGQGYNLVLPDVIYIYQSAHERYCRTDAEVVEQARKTLLHEIGHYFGIDEDRMHDLGMG